MKTLVKPDQLEPPFDFSLENPVTLNSLRNEQPPLLISQFLFSLLALFCIIKTAVDQEKDQEVDQVTDPGAYQEVDQEEYAKADEAKKKAETETKTGGEEEHFSFYDHTTHSSDLGVETLHFCLYSSTRGVKSTHKKKQF